LAKARQLADIQKDDGFAALHLAALNGHYDTAEALISTVSFLNNMEGCSFYDHVLYAA